MFRKTCLNVSLLLSLILQSHEAAAGKCDLPAFNPVKDVAWNGLFPIRVGGARVSAATPDELPDTDTPISNPVCYCTTTDETYVGVKVDFWNISYLAEIVKDPYCSTVLGTSLEGSNNSTGTGTTGTVTTKGFPGSSKKGGADQKTKAPRTFMHSHWITFPVMQLIGMMLDSKCGKTEEFTFLDMSEVSLTYSNDHLANLSDPKSLLVANPVADIAAIPSYVMAQAPNGFYPPAYDAFFWAWWYNIYPLVGAVNQPHSLSVSAHLAARQVYSKTSDGGVLDYTLDPMACTGKYQSIPKKSQWRFQLAKPGKSSPIIAGRTELLWGSGKNPPYKDGNFLWVLFQKMNCCQKIKGSNS